jgi:hypothetical protein
MINNLQFYGIAALVGLIISLAFRKETTVEKWKVMTIVAVPVCWARVGVILTLSVGDRSIEGLRGLPRYFDARNFFPEGDETKSVRVLGVVGLVAVAYFSLAFDLLWGLKNKAKVLR